MIYYLAGRNISLSHPDIWYQKLSKCEIRLEQILFLIYTNITSLKSNVQLNLVIKNNCFFKHYKFGKKCYNCKKQKESGLSKNKKVENIKILSEHEHFKATFNLKILIFCDIFYLFLIF